MQLLEYFKELTLHPKNAEELKGLILQLAVQGKLTRQWREENPDVEPASILLERINDEKARLIKENKIKKEKPLPEISEEEIPNEIPAGWIWCRLGEIITLKSGQDLTPNEYSDIDQIGLPYITGASNLQNEGVIVSRWTNTPRSIAYEGDLLLTCKGSGVGKMGWLKEVEAHIARQIMAVNTIFSRLEFIKLFLDIKLKYFKKVANGLIPGIDRKTVLEIPFPLPPLEEQKAIVEVVNQLFTEVEQLEALTKVRIQIKADFVTSALNQLTQAAEQDTASQWSFLKEHFGTFFTEKSTIKKLREGILQLAVQGKLTHHWRTNAVLSRVEVESAATLFEKIKAEKEVLIKEGTVKKSRSIDKIIRDNCFWEIPDTWVNIELQDLFRFIDYRGKTPSKSNSGKRLITAKNIRMGYIKNDPVEYVSDKFYKDWMVRGFPKIGDILFVTEGHTMGFVSLINLDYEFALAQRTICLQTFLKMDKTFYFYTLMSPQFQLIVVDNQTGSAAGGVKASKLKRFSIPLPPLEEQNAIVEKVNALMDLCDKLEQEIETYQTNQEQWMQSCLREIIQ
jgi:type I restriction enzyme S subunit